MAKKRRSRNLKKQPHILRDREHQARSHYQEALMEEEYYDEEDPEEAAEFEDSWEDAPEALEMRMASIRQKAERRAEQQAGYEEAGSAGDGYEETGYEETGYEETGFVEPGYEENGYAENGYDEAGYREDYPEQEEDLYREEPGYVENGYEEPGDVENGYDEPEYQDTTGYRDDYPGRDEGPYREETGYEDTGYDSNGFRKAGYGEDTGDREDYVYREEGPCLEEPGYEAPGYEEGSYEGNRYEETGYEEPGYEDNGYQQDTGYQETSMDPEDTGYYAETPYEKEQGYGADPYNAYPVRRKSSKKKKKKHRNKKYRGPAAGRRSAGLPLGMVLPIAVAVLTAAAVFITAGITYSEYKKRVYTKAVVEAGDRTLTPEDFRKRTDKAIVFANEEQIAAIDLHVPGEYPVDLKSGLFTYHATLTVQDTVAPTAEGEPLEIGLGDTAEATQLLKNVQDETALHISYETEPDLNRIGRQPVTIRLMDMGGNYTVVNSELIVTPIHPELVKEAGDPVPTLSDFLLAGVDPEQAAGVQLLTPVTEEMMHTVGETQLQFSMGADFGFAGKLVVRDTVAPAFEVVDTADMYVNQQLVPEEFVTDCVDETVVTYAFATPPDVSGEGTRDLEIVATDEGGNSATRMVKLVLVADTEGPVISGTDDLTYYVTDSISYRNGVTLSDNCDKPEDIKLEIDTSQVVSGTAGTYPVVYKATDLTGNTTEKTVQLHLITKSYDEATVTALASQVISSIITPGMSEYDKVVAIYNWVTKNVRYAEQPNMTDWLKAAYDGLAQHKGDCYVYCMTSKALFDAAGIKNMVIDTVPLRYIHFWNLVDIGEGWHHFDCTPRRAGGVFLYWTDAQIKEYSDAHNNSHIYDKSRFPDIP